MQPEKISRRTVVKSLALGAVCLALPPKLHADEKPALHAYTDYGWLRGFSMVPSWGTRIEDAWWNYNGDRYREEVALARQVHANCIRLWIEFTAWMTDPEKVTANFLDAVKATGEAGMKTMPTIFNRWHDDKWDYGGQYTENLHKNWSPQLDYVRAIVKPLANDSNVLIWDLCNEPQAQNLNDATSQKEFAWLKDVAAAVRQCGARQPVTIGTMTGANITTFAPLCDVLCAHPYAHTQDELKGLIASFDAMRKTAAKPMLVNECIPGCLDDIRRGTLAKFYTEMLEQAGLGWMGWALREGKAISTRRDRYDGNGLDGQGFHPFFTKEGKLRGGLEFLTQKPKALAPWEK